MTWWAVVPLKERAACKSRLAPLLSAADRRRLVQALLDHVLHVLKNTPGIEQVVVVSPDVDIANGTLLLTCNRVGLNEDLAFALGEAAFRGARRALVIPPDLPYLRCSDVVALMEAASRSGAAIAPDQRHDGTNGLAIELPVPLPLAFGQNSFRQHLARFHERRIAVTTVRRDGFEFDVDEVADVMRLQRDRDWSGRLEPLVDWCQRAVI